MFQKTPENGKKKISKYFCHCNRHVIGTCESVKVEDINQKENARTTSTQSES